MDPPSRKRVKQPLELIKHSFKRAKHQGTSESSASSSTGALPHTSSHVNEQYHNVSIVDGRSEDSPEPANSMQEDIVDATEPSPSAPTIGLQVAELDNLSSVEQLAPGQPHQGPLREASTKKGLKKAVTGIVGQAANALKVGPLKDVSDLLQGIADMYITEGAVNKEYEALRQRLQALRKVLEGRSNIGTSPEMVSKMNGIREFIEQELCSLGNQQSGEQYRPLLGAQKKEYDFLVCCRRIQEYMDRLALDAYLSTCNMEEEQSEHRLSTSLRIGRVEEQHARDRMSTWINRLPSAHSAWYNSSVGEDLERRECTPGTRVDVLATLLGWATNNSMDTLYWLNGMAGTGKTTIAYSVCKELDHSRKLAASFFCSRLREECRDVKVIIPSIAYQLAQSSLPFQRALSTVIEENQDAHHKVLEEQFGVLIRKPLLAMLDSEPEAFGGMVVVIDALDECENTESTRRILGVLLSKTEDLPIKFIVSSRPEPQIRDVMTDKRIRSRLVLHELDTGNVQADIETYLREELKLMNPSPTEAQIATLVQRAGILFIYAATAVRYIGYDSFQSDPEDRLRVILDQPHSQDGQHKEIDHLYMTVLETALGNPDLRPVERDRMRQVLYTVICTRQSLTVTGLSELLQINSTGRVRAALRPLWSVLHVIGASELVTTLHASFPDFMFDLARSKSYYCDSVTHNQTLANHCFELIKRTRPQFNICGLESSYLPDESIPNIEDLVAEAILPELLYACRFWADHVDAGKCALALVEPLQDFLSSRLLLWMEILNLNRQMKAGTECMKTMVKWCDRFEADQELIELAQDAERFVEAFASNPISQSTPHIYVSMLTFWPKSRTIAKHYAKYTHGPVKAEGTALSRRQLAHLATWAFDKLIWEIAVSPDGRYVALRHGKNVIVVDSSSGRVAFGPFAYHNMWIRSMAFSPDSTRLYAGFTDDDDATILGWDTHTSTSTDDPIFGPLQLKGHTSRITLLRFSFDCARIATGSEDKTVRVWDAENGNLLHCLETHDMVRDAAFSPDGTQIAAGFKNTLQIWDSETGDTTLGPITTPVPVDMLCFSPDKSRIIYASMIDRMIYVLDARSGKKILGPIEGHRYYIECIGCSPDGRYIVSGSRDRTVCVWDAQNGNMVLGPLEAHTNGVYSVAFSPDGSRIISACANGLVCTWDARQRDLPSNSGNPPLDPITCVKFSSDGSRFATGSEAGTICMWDALTGEIAVGPIKAHAHQINAVDFLSDRVVSGSRDGKICICDAHTGEVVLGPLELHPWSGVQAIACSPNGKHIATGSDNEINLWDAQTGSRVLWPLTGLQGSVGSIQFSPDGTRIVGSSWGWSGSIGVWDVSDGKNLFGTLDGHESWVNSVSYSPNGALIASGSNDHTIIIWDAYTGKKALDPLTGHSSLVLSVHFSPDSARLVSGSFDGTIRIWDVRTGEMVFELLHRHKHYIRSVAYSLDGTRILSLSDDLGVRIHNAQSPEERARSRHESEVDDWTIHKDGWVVDDEGRLLVWVPGDLREALMWSSTWVIVAPQGFVRLRFNKSRMGHSWAKGFISDS